MNPTCDVNNMVSEGGREERADNPYEKSLRDGYTDLVRVQDLSQNIQQSE